MKRIFIIAAIVLSGTGLVQAQNEIDLLNLALTRQSPSARMAAMGGAFNALGADAGAITLNPAGLGSFRRSSVSFTPGLNFTGSKGTYLGADDKDKAVGGYIGQLGYVYSQDLSKRNSVGGSAWKYVNYGFTINRTNSFLNNQRYKGVNSDHSMVDLFVQEANTDPDVFRPENYPYTASLAYTTGLIFPSVPGNDSSVFMGIVPNAGIEQSGRLRTRGATNEYSFSVAGNYNNMLFLGGSVGLVSTSYTNISNYTERDHMDTIFDFKDFTYQQSQFVNADGVVIKLGAILQPVEWLRLGLSYESPTWYTVSDDYETKIDANYDSVPVFASAASPVYTPFIYTYNKPGRITAGMAFLFGAVASLSIDYDYIDYSKMNVEALNNADAVIWAANLNNTVRSTFKATSNVRIGGEYIYGPLAFRAGFAYWGSPYQEGVNTGGADYSRLDYTAGAGVKLGKVGLDLSVIHNRTKGYWLPYYLDGRNTYDVQFRNNQTMVQATMSFRLD